MVVIESNDGLKHLNGADIVLVIPVWSSRRGHELMFPISFIYLRDSDGRDFIVNLNHIDANTVKDFDIHQYVNENTLVYGNRYLNTIGLDYEYVYSECIGTPFSLKEQTRALYTTYKNDYIHMNDCVPLMKWLECLRDIPYISERRPWFRNYSKAITTLGRLEGAGVKVDREKFIDTFNISDSYIAAGDIVYTQYNPYTTTGRPSNHHLNINWSALNKRDGTRRAIQSRFPNGSLVQFDFESYHLRLIGKLVKYPFPLDTDVHTHLAGLYGGIDREAAKAISFKYLYGELDDFARTIPFFGKVDGWITELWQKFITDRHLTTSFWAREIPKSAFGEETPSRQKVFNYLLQSLETESNYIKMAGVLDAIDGLQSKAVLYTYDAILFDVHPDEKSRLIDIVKSVLQIGGFPIKIYEGKNYDDLVLLN